jgi:tetratricopeptide (TPR) repeat protein
MSTLDLIEEFGRVVPPIPEYEVLYKLTCEIRERHDGELAAGASFLRRGATLLSAGRPSEALTYITRARERLAKYEALDGLSRALGATAIAYEDLGLRWAARLELVRALAIEIKDVELDAKATRLAADFSYALHDARPSAPAGEARGYPS